VGNVIHLLLPSPAEQHHHPTTSTVLYGFAPSIRLTTPIWHRRASSLEILPPFGFARSARGIWVPQHRLRRPCSAPCPAHSMIPKQGVWSSPPTRLVAVPRYACWSRRRSPGLPQARIQVRMRVYVSQRATATGRRAGSRELAPLLIW
jgi:hypothetical protein